MALQGTHARKAESWVPVLLRDVAGDAARPSLEGPQLLVREWGRVLAGDMALAGLACDSCRTGLLLLNGL